MSHNPPTPSPRSALNLALRWAEQGRLPDAMLRAGIRALLRERLQELRSGDAQATAAQTAAFLEDMRRAPLALHPEAANAQHYELPPDFFGHVLGPHRKYSACHWGPEVQTLEQAEAQALALSGERAQLQDGQRVLELGCGWGSLSMWMAQHYPHSEILAISNSQAQRAHIEAEAARRGLRNLRVQTCDFNDFDSSDAAFDRIVSIEMFEHLRNWPRAFSQVARWLAPGGRFFMHVFTHREAAYPFEARDASDWMSQYFFTGGMMPSDDLALRCQDDLRLRGHWRWDGTHYQRTAGAWLARMDARRREIMPLFTATYGADQAGVWWVRWRLFFMAVEELFGYAGGQQWWVSHYLFDKR